MEKRMNIDPHTLILVGYALIFLGYLLLSL